MGETENTRERRRERKCGNAMRDTTLVTEGGSGSGRAGGAGGWRGNYKSEVSQAVNYR
jgi:hypothetical protein